MRSILKEAHEIPSSRRDLRKFGITLGIVFGCLGALFLWRGRSPAHLFLAVGIFFLSFGILFPTWLKPVQRVWMTLALLMGWVMTRVILIFVFYGVVTPISLIIRFSGKDLLKQKCPEKEGSYWLDHPARAPEDYERQF